MLVAWKSVLHEPLPIEIVPLISGSHAAGDDSPPPVFSDFFELQAYCALKGAEVPVTHSIRKLIRQDKLLISFSDRGEFEDVCIFDAATGQFLRKIGRHSEQGNGYKCLRDIAVKDGEIVFLDSGDMEFMHYDLAGNLKKTVKNGVFGDNLMMGPDGSYWVYNEHNESEVSGAFFLLRFDRNGNLTDRIRPYETDGRYHIIDYTGELVQSGDRIWFNPPFSDTIFELNPKSRALTPRYVLNPPDAMSEADKKRARKGRIPYPFRYLDFHFAPMSRGLLYAWAEDTQIYPMYYDQNAMVNLSLRDGIAQGGINQLVAKSFMIYPIDGDRVMMQIPYGILDRVMAQPGWEESLGAYPGLADEIRYGAENQAPLILTFAAKK